jgi:type IV pilus assembly protein PilQ
MRYKKCLVFLLSIVFILSNSIIVHSDTVVQQAGMEEVSSPGNVTLVFKDADIRTVLHTLSYKSGVNIVASSDVEGTVSIRLVDVPWETALEVILKNQGLAVERVGNIMRVITLASVAEEELQNEVFILNYAKAADIAGSIESTVTERGSIKFDERTNTLIVTDIPTNLYKVRSVVNRLDKRTPQVMIEAQLIETTLNKDENLGIDWTMVVKAYGSQVPTTFPFTRDFSNMPKSIRERYMPMSQTELRTYRLEQEYVAGDPAADPPTDPKLVDLEYKRLIDLPGSRFLYPAVGDFKFGTLDFTELSAVLEILNSRADTKTISKPTIITLNNKEASVHLGEEYYLPEYTINEQTGRWELTGYKREKIGVTLEVTPHINDVGDIVINLKPEVSALSDYQNLGGGITLPVFSKRNAEAQIMVRDNQTIAMGGLMKEMTRKYENKVPILGDIPLLGNLFKKTEDGVVTTDLLIFLTVRMIGDDHDDKALMEEAKAKTIRDDKTKKVTTGN